MATGNPIECGVCQETFNEDLRCPRNLPCSHHLCSDCINQLITQKSIVCPFCRKEFTANSARDVMINHGLLECAKYISVQEKNAIKYPQRKRTLYQRRIAEFKEDASKANKEVLHNLQILKKQAEKLTNEAQELRMSLHQESTKLKENILPEIHNTIQRIDRNSECLELNVQRLEAQLNEIEKKEGLLASAERKLDSVRSLEDTGATVDEIEETNIAVCEWVQDLQESLAEDEGQLQSTRKEVVVAKRMRKDFLDVLSSKVGNEEINPILNIGAVAEQMELSRELSAMALWEKRSSVIRLVEQQRLFAVKQEGNSRRSAKISMENNKLHLYSLKDEPKPDPNSYYLEYDEVLRLALSPSCMFLDICARGSTLGRIHIRLNEESKRYELVLHCTGGRRNCYVDTPLQVVDKGSLLERVVCGRQMSNAVSGNMQNHSWKNKNARELWPDTCRTVKILENGQPPILAFGTGPYKDWNGDTPNTVIGIVTDGLSMVRDSIRCFDDIRDITIGSCGLVLSTKSTINESTLQGSVN